MTTCVWYLAGKSCGTDITVSNRNTQRNTHRHKREAKVLCYTDESEGGYEMMEGGNEGKQRKETKGERRGNK